MKRPTKLKILHLTYRVKEAKDHACERGAQWGWLDRETQTIYLVPGMTGEREREILFHEIGHAINELLDIDGVEDEEICQRGSVAWMTVFRDNPKLVDWMFNRKRKKRK